MDDCSAKKVSESSITRDTKPLISIVSPVYNEELNLQRTYEEICVTFDQIGGDIDWEWIAVDDHSIDSSTQILEDLSQKDPRVRYIRFARNEGSHVAIAAGLQQSTGRCAAVLASDGQDPPGELLRMLGYWLEGYQIVWLARHQESKSGYMPSIYGRLWYALVRRLPGLKNQPAAGADAFLVDGNVVNVLRESSIRKVAITLFLRSLGFRQIDLLFEKRQRIAGTSSWTFKKKVQHMKNTLMYFTNLPIRFVTGLGFSISLVSACYAFYVFVYKMWVGQPQEGWASSMFVTSMGISVTMLLLGILGEYLWRIFEYSRKSLEYMIESRSDKPSIIISKHEYDMLEPLLSHVKEEHKLNMNSCVKIED